MDFYDRCCRRRITAQRWQRSFLRGSTCCSQGVFRLLAGLFVQKTSVTQMLAKLFFSRTSSCGTLRLLQTLKVLLQKTFVTQPAESFSRTTSCGLSHLFHSLEVLLCHSDGSKLQQNQQLRQSQHSQTNSWKALT